MGRTRPGRPVAIGAWPVSGGTDPVPAQRALDATEGGVRAVWRLPDRPAPAGTPVGPAGPPAAAPAGRRRWTACGSTLSGALFGCTACGWTSADPLAAPVCSSPGPY